MALEFAEVKNIAWKVVQELFAIDPLVAATGTPSASTFLRGDFAWATPPTTQAGITYQTLGMSATLAKDTGYIFTANSIVGTLPASPATGDKIFCVSDVATLTGCSIARNGKTIMALAENMTIDDNRAFWFGLVYDGIGDWRLI